MDLRPDHVGIIVSDLARSKAFYSTLGFEQTVEHVSEEKTITFMRLGDLQVELFAYNEAIPAPADEGRTLGFRHLALATSDIDSDLAELKAAGMVAPDAAIRELPGGWRLLFFNDPDGVEIEIMQA